MGLSAFNRQRREEARLQAERERAEAERVAEEERLQAARAEPEQAATKPAKKGR